MGLGWADWIRFVLTPLLLGLIAAIVATRNAKKTPHERLKNLVDIHDKIPDGLDSRNVVEAAIVRELVDFDRRVAADQRGLWAGVKERSVQFGGPIGALLVAGACVVALPFLFIEFLRDENNEPWPTVISTAASIVAIAFGLFASQRSFRTERKSLNLDRAAAYITATFARAVIQDLASRDVLSSADVEGILGESAPRLEAMGVVEGDSSSGDLRVTPFGKKAIGLSLREVDRQYFAHWAKLNAEMKAREDESGREAPEQ